MRICSHVRWRVIASTRFPPHPPLLCLLSLSSLLRSGASRVSSSNLAGCTAGLGTVRAALRRRRANVGRLCTWLCVQKYNTCISNRQRQTSPRYSVIYTAQRLVSLAAVLLRRVCSCRRTRSRPRGCIAVARCLRRAAPLPGPSKGMWMGCGKSHAGHGIV